MAKKTKNSSVNSSIRQNTADTNLGFDKILTQQEQSTQILRAQLELQAEEFMQSQTRSKHNLDMLNDLGKVIRMGIDDARLREENLQKEKEAAERLAKAERAVQRLAAHREKQKADEQAALDKEIQLKKKAIAHAKHLNRLREEENKAVLQISKNMETFRSMGDRLSDTSKKLKDNFGSMSALKTTALKAFNIGGIFNKSIAKEKFINQQKELGSTDDRKTLAGKFESANLAAKDIKKNEQEISTLKESTGLNEKQLATTEKGKALLAKREQGVKEYKKYDIKAGLVKPAGLENVSPTEQHANSAAAEETQIETVKQIEVQSDLLQKIADNTSPEGQEQKQKGSGSEGGGGIMSGIGAGLKSLGGGLAGLGKGIGSGIQGLLTGIARGVMAFGNPKVLLGAAAMTLLGGAVFVMAKALKEFESLEWETIGKGMAAIAGFGAIGALLGAVAAPVALGSAALGLLGGALWVVGKAMAAIGEGFEAMTSGLERLAGLDGSNLLSVAAGVTALGLAMAAFGAGQAVAGMGQLVGNLLTIGSDSPVEQLIKIGEKGQGVKDAAEGMEKLGTAMGAFSKIDKKSMEAINDFPWLKATAFVAAGGSMQVDGAAVTQASKQNADAAAAGSGSGGGNTAVVNAPVTTNNNTSQIIKSPIRNQESSMSRFIGSRFSRA
jgi:hypothetical protein